MSGSELNTSATALPDDPHLWPMDVKVATFCVEPWLTPSKHESIHTSVAGKLPCYMYCDEDPSRVFYSPSEQSTVLTVIAVFSSLTLISALLLCFNTLYHHFWGETAQIGRQYVRRRVSVSRRGGQSVSERMRDKFDKVLTSFKERPFSYDVPFCVTIGCILIGLALLVPQIIGRDKVCCHRGENTYVAAVPSTFQGTCFFFGVLLLFGTHLVFGYQSALSVSLWRITKGGMSHTKASMFKRKRIHVALYLWISAWLIVGISLNGFAGDPITGTCTSGSLKKNALLFTLFIPSCIYACVSSVFSALVIYNLRRHIRNSDTPQAMSKFTFRFSLYSLLCTAGAILFCYATGRLYFRHRRYKDSGREFAACRINSLYNSGLECDRENMPPQHLFLILPVTAFAISFGALILSFNRENVAKWKQTCCSNPAAVLKKAAVSVSAISWQSAEKSTPIDDCIQSPSTPLSATPKLGDAGESALTPSPEISKKSRKLQLLRTQQKLHALAAAASPTLSADASARDAHVDTVSPLEADLVSSDEVPEQNTELLRRITSFDADDYEVALSGSGLEEQSEDTQVDGGGKTAEKGAVVGILEQSPLATIACDLVEETDGEFKGTVVTVVEAVVSAVDVDTSDIESKFEQRSADSESDDNGLVDEMAASQ